MLVSGKVANTINSARVPAAWPKQKHDTENDVMYHSYCYLFKLCTALTSLLQVRVVCMFVTWDLQIKGDYNWICVLQGLYCKDKIKLHKPKQEGELVVTVNHVLLTFQVKLTTHPCFHSSPPLTHDQAHDKILFEYQQVNTKRDFLGCSKESFLSSHILGKE